MDKKSAIIAMVEKMENEAALNKAYDFIKRIYRRGAKKGANTKEV